jgi:hypothetical protein
VPTGTSKLSDEKSPYSSKIHKTEVTSSALKMAQESRLIRRANLGHTIQKTDEISKEIHPCVQQRPPSTHYLIPGELQRILAKQPMTILLVRQETTLSRSIYYPLTDPSNRNRTFPTRFAGILNAGMPSIADYQSHRRSALSTWSNFHGLPLAKADTWDVYSLDRSHVFYAPPLSHENPTRGIPWVHDDPNSYVALWLSDERS